MNKPVPSSFWKIVFDGDHYEVSQATNSQVNSLEEAQIFTPEGAYTTFRTYERFKVLNLSHHFDRLENTVSLAGGKITIQREALKRILVGFLSHFSAGESRVRISIDLTIHPYDFYVALEPLKVPSADEFREGVMVAIESATRENPQAKLNHFLSIAAEIREQHDANCEEVIMMNETGELREGLSSNFFAIKDGQVFTAEEGVLFGTTRAFVIDLINKLEIPLVRQPLKVADLAKIKEAFITSTSRSILPIRTIDSNALPKPVPGLVTKKLMKRFDADLADALEDLRS